MVLSRHDVDSRGNYVEARSGVWFVDDGGGVGLWGHRDRAAFWSRGRGDVDEYATFWMRRECRSNHDLVAERRRVSADGHRAHPQPTGVDADAARLEFAR